MSISYYVVMLYGHSNVGMDAGATANTINAIPHRGATATWIMALQERVKELEKLLDQKGNDKCISYC